MQETSTATIVKHFSELDDPRRYNKRHLLLDMIVIAICGADTWVDVENFGKAKYDWFKQCLELPRGIPYVSIGESKIKYIGCWMSLSEKMTVEYEREMEHRTLLFCATLL